MGKSYLVQRAIVKQTRAGKDYLLLTLNDKFVSFFDEKDAKVKVEQDQYITCRIVQKGNFMNGYDIAVVDKPNDVTTGEAELQFEKDDSVLVAGTMTYTLDVRTAKNDAKYLSISVSSSRESQRIVIFEDHIKEFTELFNKKVKEF